MRIDRAERVVQEVYICIAIDSSSELNPLLLTSTHVEPSLADLCKVSMIEVFYILVQSTRFDCLLIQFLVEGLSEEYIVADSATLYP